MPQQYNKNDGLQKQVDALQEQLAAILAPYSKLSVLPEVSEAELAGVSSNLQKQIDALDTKISLFPDPFSKVSMQRVQKGGTGAARFRRIPLYSDVTSEVPVTTTRGNFDLMSHHELVDNNSDKIFYSGVVVPTDYIAVGQMTFNYMYSSTVATDDIDWIVVVKSITDTATSEISLLSDTTSVAAPGVVSTLAVRSVALTTLPKIDTVLYATLERTVGDANAGVVSVWAAWLEYIAFI